MSSVTPRVEAEMDHYTSFNERLPRVVVAVAAAVAAVYAPNVWLKSLLAGVAATVSATVVFSAADAIGAAAANQEEPHWRTLKTYRVEA
jgi:hypothetical protein